MNGQQKKTPCNIGLLAHVDAGKTTLSEALLYVSGARRTLGRVDHRDAYLDTHNLERARGITIFSKQAQLETAHRTVTLVDTPGHVDFSAEAERVMGIRAAMFSPGECCAVEESIGRVLGAASVGCPPAVPVVMCGERIDGAAAECFRYYGIESCWVLQKES